MESIKKILAIESSCDETAASVIDSSGAEPLVLSNIVSSQIDLHKLTGGVVPEVAARAHLEAINPVIDQALKEAETKLSEIDAIAVTNGPGLIGALLVGFNTAKTLAYALRIPLIPINHIEGHIYSTSLNRKQELVAKNQSDGQFPVLALTVSGGHTSLTLVKDHGSYQTIGETVDDAAGEAFDKVAKLLGLGYPGGPAVSKLAEQFRNGVESQKSIKSKVKEKPSREVGLDSSGVGFSGQGHLDFKFPRPMLHSGDFNFSFSGLKTAVLHKVRELTDNGKRLTDNDKSQICCAFEEAVVDVLCSKTLKAAKKLDVKTVILAGGVSANKHLQSELSRRLQTAGCKLFTPPPEMTGDNAAMIGIAAFYHINSCHPALDAGSCGVSTWDKVSVDSNLRL